MPYRGMPGITKGFKLTGGPPSNAGQMADAGTINDTYAALRAKSSSINKIPGAQMILDAKKFAAEEDAKTLREKAEWDAKGLAAKYDYYSDSAKAKGNSAMVGGALSGLAGVGMGAFNLFSGKGGADDVTKTAMDWSNIGDNEAFKSYGGMDFLNSLDGQTWTPMGS